MKSGEVVAGRYRLDARLGIGGMGEVWKATHEATSREFALKFMHAHTAASASARQRFTREARVSARINHPNVIDIFDAGEHGESTLYLAMELLDGISLADALHLAPPLSAQDLLVVMHDTALALAAAHAVGIVHRDIKPANVFLHKDRASGFASAKILDFGISKFTGNVDENHTQTGAILGSPRYMSPEQTRSAASVDHRSDLWACGVILFEGFTGTWPHEGDSFSSLVVAICTAPPASIDRMVPDLPDPVRALVRDCLKPIDQRLQSAGELATRIAAVLQDPTLAQRPLARPLHPPSEAIKAPNGVRIRPHLTSTHGGADPLRSSSSDADLLGLESVTTTQQRAPESLRTTQPRARPTDTSGVLRAPVAAGLRGDLADQGAQEIGIEDVDPLAEMATTPLPPSLVALVVARGLPAALSPPAPLPRPPAPDALLPAGAAALRPSAFDAPSMALPQSVADGGLRLPQPGTPTPLQRTLTDPGATPRPADSLSGTLETLATTTVREPSARPAPAIPAALSFGAPPLVVQPAPASGMRLAVAVLSVLLAIIVVALVTVVRSSTSVSAPPGQAAPVASEPAPPVTTAATEFPAPLPPTSATVPEPAPTPTLSASAAPSDKPPDRPRGVPAHPPPPPRGSRVKQLGSGL